MESDIQILDKQFTSEFDDIIKKSLNRFPIFHFKNKEFLQWRYMNHPTRNYQVLTLRNNSKLIGYIISREMNIFSKKLGVIVDFVIDPNYEQRKIFQKLIKSTLINFWNREAPAMSAASVISSGTPRKPSTVYLINGTRVKIKIENITATSFIPNNIIAGSK